MRTIVLLALVSSMLSCGLPAPEPMPESPSKKVPNSWFMRQRLDETGTMPVLARSRALDVVRKEDGSIEATAGSWQLAGPRNIGGRISTLAEDPNDAGRIWLGAADGGVFLSTDGGDTWAPVFDDQTAMSIASIATHPTDSNTVYVGTGEEAGGSYSYDGEGVLKTTDGGATWAPIGLAAVRRISRVAVDPLTPDTVFVAAMGGLYHKDGNRGVYRSLDGGQSWSLVLFVEDDAGASDVAIDPSDPNRIYAGIWERYRGDNESHYGGAASGIYRSLDGGDSWTQLTSGLPTGSLGRIGLAIAPSNPSVVYAIIGQSSGSLNGIYRSIDGGDSWTKVSNAQLPFFFSSFTYYFGQIRVDPANANIVYALDINLWRSTNGGSNFNSLSGLHADQHALRIQPGGVLLVGNDGGFYRSDDGGGSFVHNLTLPISQFYDLCIDTLNPVRRFGGTQDNGTLRTEAAGLDDWDNVLGGDGMQCEVDPTDSMKVYAESQWGGIARSTDGGDSFTGATSGIDPTDRNNWVTPITVDPVNPTTLYTGTQRVYRSVDSAVSWSAISNDLSDGPGDGPDTSGDPHWRENQDHGRSPIQGTVTAIGVSPVDNQILWAGTDDGNVWVSDDDGTIWTDVTPLPKYWVTELHPDPDDASTVYATVAGYRLNDRMPYVRKSTDLGQSWTDVTGDLPQVPMNSVVRDPMWLGRLFAASDVGVHVSDDDGAGWDFLGSGMPRIVVQDLVLHDGSRTLFAGTHARSMMSYDLGQLGPADGDGDGVDNNNDCALADPGAFAAPTEVQNLRITKGVSDSAQLSWDGQEMTAGPGTLYDVATDTLANLRVAGNTSGSTSLACDLAAPMVADAFPPAPGTGVYYMARAKNACGIAGWGSASNLTPRTSNACP